MPSARRPLLSLCLVTLIAIVATAPALAAPPENATVFPVTRGGGDFPDGNTFYQDIAVRPSDDRAMLVGVGVNDAVVAANATLEAYDFDLRNFYFGVDWYPSGERALVASYDIPSEGDAGSGYRFGRGGGDLWLWEDGVFTRVYSGNVTLQSVAVNDEGAALVAGSALARSAPRAPPTAVNTLLYAPDGRSFQRLEVPTDGALRTVAWAPDGERALVGGADGTLLLVEDGDVTDVSLEGGQFVEEVAWRGDTATLAGGTTTDRFLPGGNGTVLAWRDGTVEPLARLPTPVRDVAWRHDGVGLAVGAGPEGNGSAHWIGRDADVAALELDAKRLRAAAWIDGDTALLAGDREIWRYDETLDPEALPTTASLTVTPERAAPNASVRLNGWGSTDSGSTERIEAWQFSTPGTETLWRASPRFETRFARNGTADVAVRVRARDGSVSGWTNRTVRVALNHTHSAVTHRHGNVSGNGAGDSNDSGAEPQEDGGLPPWAPFALAGFAFAGIYAWYAAREEAP